MLNGEWQDRGFLSGEIQSTIVDTSGEPQEKVVKPSIVPVVVEADAGKKLTKVTVEAVSSDIDVDIQPDDIREGVEILGVVGTLEPKEDIDAELNEQDTLLAELQSSVDELQEKPYDMLQARVDETNSCEYLFYNYSGDNVDFIKNLDISNVTSMVNMFNGCTKLLNVPKLKANNVTGMTYMFYYCIKLTNLDLSGFNTSNVQNMESTFYNCEKLTSLDISGWNTSNVLNMGSMFQYCHRLASIYGEINMIKCSQAYSMFASCTDLTNLTLKNIKISLQIGSGTTWGHLLTLDSLLNTIKELHTNTGTTTLTLTVGSANLEKLANVYVKLIDITDEMRAEDEYIDNKAPFEVCESTDANAMLITEYVTTVKNWQIA